jgi:signal transduction histidine kinase
MRERAQRVEGTLTWQRRNPAGTRVQLRVPAVAKLLRA